MSSRLHRLSALGQSVWIDFLSRDLLASGALARAIDEDAVVGVTSNPTILERRSPRATPTTHRSGTPPTATPSTCSTSWSCGTSRTPATSYGRPGSGPVAATATSQSRSTPTSPTTRVAVAFFGDGATNSGAFHESLNLAQLWHVPVVFVCENNRWAESTPQSQHQPIEDLTVRAVAFGMQAMKVDGQDVEAVHLAAREALAHARAGHGPVFLLCETERLTGHYIGDAQVYRDKDKLRELRETRDPIENLRGRLELSEEAWVQLDNDAQRIVDTALEFAQAGTDPAPSDAIKYVYAP